MKGHCFLRKQRIAVHLRLQKVGAADHGVDIPVDTAAVPQPGFQHTDDAFRQRAVDAPAFHTASEVSAQTFFAVFPGIGVVAHMVGAYQLVIMGRENHPAGVALLLPFGDFQQDGGG